MAADNPSRTSMLNYTDRARLLMEDIVSRVSTLSFINMRDVVVFARLGRTTAHGAFATCHSLLVPDSDPAYYYWRDRRTGRLTRRSEWFVMRSPQVRIGATRVKYLISLTLPRFADQTLKSSRKEEVYAGFEPWVAKLDTLVHELYHVDPHDGGIRKSVRGDGRPAAVTHTPQFFREVAAMVREYLASGPDPAVYEFLRHDFADLTKRHGVVVGTTFTSYPSFPQRYRLRVDEQPRAPRVPHVVPLNDPRHPAVFTDADLQIRAFTPRSARPIAAGEPAGGRVRGVFPRPVPAIAANRQPR
jgi:hypothetical protein